MPLLWEHHGELKHGIPTKTDVLHNNLKVEIADVEEVKQHHREQRLDWNSQSPSEEHCDHPVAVKS